MRLRSLSAQHGHKSGLLDDQRHGTLWDSLWGATLGSATRVVSKTNIFMLGSAGLILETRVLYSNRGPYYTRNAGPIHPR